MSKLPQALSHTLRLTLHGVVLLATLWLLAALPQLAAAEPGAPTLQFLWCVPKDPADHPFRSPLGLGYDSERERVYLADTNGNRIVVLNASGAILYDFKHWGTLPDGRRVLGSPRCVLPADRGTVLVADDVNDRIDVLDAWGAVVDSLDLADLLGQQERAIPGAMARDNAGNLYVVDRATSRVVVLDKTRRVLRTFGGQGKGDGQFEEISDLAVAPDGTAYVLDLQQNPVVQVFDPSGKRLAGFGRHGDKEADFHFPVALALDDVGRVWIADAFSHDVKVYSTSGKYLTDLGGMGDGPGEFYFPSNVVVAADKLYVLEKAGARLQAFKIVG